MLNLWSRAFIALFILLCVSSAYGHKQVVVITLGGDGAPPRPTVYAIGDTGPGGGKVFHVTNDGLNGLEAAPVDQGDAPLNCDGTDAVGVVNLATSEDSDPNSGAVNTPLIAVQCPGTATNAAVLAAVYVWPNGQTDGFLPNKEELDLLHAEKDAVGANSFASHSYWSSSEANSFGAWILLEFAKADAVRFNLAKFAAGGVRAVRAF